MSAETKLQQFISQQRRLLELELHADEEQDNASIRENDGGGFYLRNVDVIDTSVGLYGRTVISFGQTSTNNGNNGNSDTSKSLLAAHRLTAGDEIEILPKNKGAKSKQRVGGVVCAVDDYSISIALEDKKRQSNNAKSSVKKNESEDIDEDSDMLGGSGPYTLVPRSGVEVHQKMMSALDQLEKHGVNHPIAGDIILSAFEPNNAPIGADGEMPSVRLEELEEECNLASTKLDYSQKEAVVFALNSNAPISLIHGPPGTGECIFDALL